MSRIGVFICHCGENIGKTVDCARVAEAARKLPGVALALDYRYTCSEPGQAQIRAAIKEHKLSGVVVAACSPRMHEKTFRKACAAAGLNPYLCEITNLREQCSWVHTDGELATRKAIDLVRSTVARVQRNTPLAPIQVPVTRRALVIGGGIAGIQAALDIADGGTEVVLVERSPSLGGHMAQLSETFPTLDCSQCIMTPRMVEAASHPRIRLETYSEVEKIEGYVGNFEVTIRRKARSVDPLKCTGCGTCWQKCPQKKLSSEFDEGLGQRTAIGIPFPQAVPNKPVIDRANCIKFKTGRCGACQKLCPTGAIDFEQQDELITEKAGAIVVATGFQVLPKDQLPAYARWGYIPMCSPGSNLSGWPRHPAPRRGNQAGRRTAKRRRRWCLCNAPARADREKGRAYCSKICCMYTAKHAMLYRHKVHGGRAIVLCMDVRTPARVMTNFTVAPSSRTA